MNPVSQEEEEYQTVEYNTLQKEYLRQNTKWQEVNRFMAYHHQSNILLQIQDLNLKNLKELKISGNGISSIQQLCRIRMQNISQIFIFNNDITKIRPLRKTYFLNLTKIMIYDNRAIDYQYLSQVQTLKKMKSIPMVGFGDRVFFQNHNWVLKVKATQQAGHWTITKIRICPTTLRIQQKFSNMTFTNSDY